MFEFPDLPLIHERRAPRNNLEGESPRTTENLVPDTLPPMGVGPIGRAGQIDRMRSAGERMDRLARGSEKNKA
jgi:hypothetical protein